MDWRPSSEQYTRRRRQGAGLSQATTHDDPPWGGLSSGVDRIHQSISITALTRSDVTRRGYREAWSAQDEGTVVVCAPKVSQSISYWNLADCKLRNHRGGSL